ncbi:hypothetical protein J6590_013952 [Homalodisca vitripennis]|nr:hypothetical protein J6590_013952 [Homalodisca vitripennis]
MRSESATSQEQLGGGWMGCLQQLAQFTITTNILVVGHVDKQDEIASLLRARAAQQLGGGWMWMFTARVCYEPEQHSSSEAGGCGCLQQLAQFTITTNILVVGHRVCYEPEQHSSSEAGGCGCLQQLAQFTITTNILVVGHVDKRDEIASLLRVRAARRRQLAQFTITTNILVVGHVDKQDEIASLLRVRAARRRVDVDVYSKQHSSSEAGGCGCLLQLAQFTITTNILVVGHVDKRSEIASLLRARAAQQLGGGWMWMFTAVGTVYRCHCCALYLGQAIDARFIA